MKCVICGKQIPAKRVTSRTKYCGNLCLWKAGRKRYHDLNPSRGHFSTGTLGAMNEFTVALDLMSRGLHVFRNMSPNGPCDLIVLADKRLIRVEVTTGIYNANGTIHYDPHKKENWDLIAAVTPHEIMYTPELATLIQIQPGARGEV